jgi:hypothetical protein
MAVYTVHQPPPTKYEAAPDPERFVFVRDGFSFWAFLLGPLWMLRHRMWLAVLGYIILMGALHFGLLRIGAAVSVTTAVDLMIALLIGFEAATLRRFTLARRKWKNVGIIVGDDREVAEQRFFDAWVRQAPAGPPAPPQPPVPTVSALRRPSAEPDVIGLFPEPRTNR